MTSETAYQANHWSSGICVKISINIMLMSLNRFVSMGGERWYITIFGFCSITLSFYLLLLYNKGESHSFSCGHFEVCHHTECWKMTVTDNNIWSRWLKPLFEAWNKARATHTVIRVRIWYMIMFSKSGILLITLTGLLKLVFCQFCREFGRAFLRNYLVMGRSLMSLFDCIMIKRWQSKQDFFPHVL